MQGGVPRIADFVHGADGFGNINVVSTVKKSSQKSEQAACDFLIQKVADNPGEITIVALGPLTNVALVRPFISKLMKRTLKGRAVDDRLLSIVFYFLLLTSLGSTNFPCTT